MTLLGSDNGVILVTCCITQERQLLLEEYQELASRLRSWLTETTAEMLHRDFPPSAAQMKVWHCILRKWNETWGPSSMLWCRFWIAERLFCFEIKTLIITSHFYLSLSFFFLSIRSHVCS